MKKPKVYIETSTVSFLVARPSENPILLAKQLLTKQWWAMSNQFELFVSETVTDEVEQGDPVAASRRLDAIAGIQSLVYNDAVEELTQAILHADAIPSHVPEDALHIAYAAVYEMNILLTWNQKHIAAPTKQFLIREIILNFNLRMPQILTPEAHLLILETD